jgi:hypothetical protein
MVRAAVATVVLILVGVGAPVATGGANGPQVGLGKKGLMPGGIGWGTAHPRLIYNGGDPNGRAWNLRWTGWGTALTHARGLTWIFKPDGGYFAKPGAIELRASRLGRCGSNGPRAYTRLEVREALRPGGPLSRWFIWGGWKSTCQGP